MIGGQRRGQIRRGGIGFLRLLRVDHGDQQVVELRKIAVEHGGALAPRQTGVEQVIGVGPDAEMVRRVEARQHGNQHTGQDNQPSVAVAELGVMLEQAREGHQVPDLTGRDWRRAAQIGASSPRVHACTGWLTQP